MAHLHPFVRAFATFACLAFAAPPAWSAPNADPSLHTDLGGLCSWNITCGGVASRIKWSPPSGTCWSSSVDDMPLAVILHGNGFAYTDYDYLQDHLAKNGIASVSLDLVAEPANTSNHQGVADDAQGYLESQCFEDNWLDNFAGATPVDFGKTAIVGHSRGGESARYLAANLASHADIDVQAVVALAPARGTTKSLPGANTQGYLLLYGSADIDVPPYKAYWSHDLAGWQEVSTPTANDLDRGMKLLVNGFHSGFVDVIAGLSLQQDTTKGYVHAFLRAWLKNDWQFYEGYIRNDDVPGPWGSVLSQFSTKASRKVVDNFEDLNVTPNTLGGVVSTVFMTDVDALDAATEADTPHAGKVLRFEPTANNAYVAWAIPAGQRNFTSFLVLSLRIAQVVGSGPVDARIGLDLGGTVQWVDLDDYGGIPEPVTFCLNGNGFNCVANGELGVMRTIRIPVDEFGSVTDVRNVYLQFLSGAVGDQFLVDNLEFAEAWQIVLP